MPLYKVGRAAQRIKTTYRLIDHAQFGSRRYALIERTRQGQLSDVCFIVVLSNQPILLNGTLRGLKAWSVSQRGFKVFVRDPRAWFSPRRRTEAEAVFKKVVRQKKRAPAAVARPKGRRGGP